VLRYLALTPAAVLLAGDPTTSSTSASLRGKLLVGDKPVLLVDGRAIHLESDDQTMLVLADDRLKDADFEVLGHFVTPDRFAVDHIHTRALFVHKDGKRLMVTYWCDVCYIRYYSPGKCWCCQKYTDLDLRDPDDK